MAIMFSLSSFMTKVHWSRLPGAVLAAVVLLPVPALALTFTSPWTANTLVLGGPTPPTPTFTDAVTGQQDDLNVDMGTYQGATARAFSAIHLTRGFTITDGGGQDVMLEADYVTFLAHAGFVVREKVKTANGHTILDISGGHFTVENASGTEKLFAQEKAIMGHLKRGDYVIAVTVSYHTNNKIGSWRMKSLHHFELLGL
jgi:hypothetical protein